MKEPFVGLMTLELGKIVRISAKILHHLLRKRSVLVDLTLLELLEVAKASHSLHVQPTKVIIKKHICTSDSIVGLRCYYWRHGGTTKA